jgi:sarcosine oxidase subunit beta
MHPRLGPVVVIGGGVIGCSIAYALATRGHRVTVLDRGSGPGTGSTSASSAVVRFSYSTLDAVTLSWESALLWERWPEYLGVADEAGYARFIKTGLLILDSPMTGLEAVRPHFEAVGVPYRAFTAEELAEQYPQLDTGRYFPPRTLDDPAFWDESTERLGGYLIPDAGYVDDPALAAHNLMTAAQHYGATFRFRSAVAGIECSDGRVCRVRLSGGEWIDAQVVVNAAGPHSRQVNALAGLATAPGIHTRALRQEVHSLPAPADFRPGAGGVAVSDSDLGTYFRPHLGDTMIVGGVEPECDPLIWVDDPDACSATPTVPAWEAQTTRMAKRLPCLAVPTRPNGVAGLYDVADDWMPLYDRTDLAGFYTAIGTSGHQFKNAPMVGPMMAELIEACESGRDHDADPVQVIGPITGSVIDIGHFSRRRHAHHTTNSVLG